MKFKVAGAVCGVLAVLGGARAEADIWVVQPGLLERLDSQGTVVDTVTGAFGQPFQADDHVRAQIDPRDGSLIIGDQLPTYAQPRTGRILKLSATGEEIWQHAFPVSTFAIDVGRRGVWLVRADPAELVLLDDETGAVVSTINLVTPFGIAGVGADGALWVTRGDVRTRIHGSPAALDGYTLSGDRGPHHRTIPGRISDLSGSHSTRFGFAVDPSNGSIWTGFETYHVGYDLYETTLIKSSARGDELLRVESPFAHSLTDLTVDPRDGSVYFSNQYYDGGVFHVSALGAHLGGAEGEYGEFVGDIVVDTEDFGIWISHSQVFEIHSVVLRKLDANRESVLDVPYPTYADVRIVGATPGPGDIAIDIQPPDRYNVVDLRDANAEVRVALLSDAEFDASQVDIDTIRFGIAGATVRWHWTRDVDRDGLTDLVVTFRAAHTGIECGNTQAPLTGQTYAGLEVRSADWLRTRCDWSR